MQIFSICVTSITVSLVLALLVAPLIIKVAHRIKFNQPMYEYVTMHAGKAGTPTMGGLIFLISIAITSVFLLRGDYKLSLVALSVTMGFGIIGFTDDYLKVTNKQNEGLKPYQKVFSQLLISTIVAVFAYCNEFVGSEIYLPFVNTVVDLKWLYIPFIIFVFIAVTNSVNLTDGLDGLAGGVSCAYLVTFCITFCFILFKQIDNGLAPNVASEMTNLMVLGFAGVGSLVGYLAFNSFPARIFMGDTGSLALGGFIASIGIFTKQIFLLPIIGACFVASSVSVVVQVLHYKRTKKRVFLMAPLHHHFEKKGVNETKIVAIYIVITILLGALASTLTALLF